MNGPYGWDEKCNNLAWSAMVAAYGLHHVVASSIDGWAPMRIRDADTSIRVNVNPDRHARIRAKHFRNAEREIGLGGLLTEHMLERARLSHGTHGDQSGENRARQASKDAAAAFDSCDWGCS